MARFTPRRELGRTSHQTPGHADGIESVLHRGAETGLTIRCQSGTISAWNRF